MAIPRIGDLVGVCGTDTKYHPDYECTAEHCKFCGSYIK